MDETPLAFRSDPREQPELELRVNFGMFAGRQVTLAELDDLARDLLDVLARVSVVSLDRHEFGDGGEAAVHQVKVEAASADAHEPDPELGDRLLALVDAWARRTIEFRHVESAEIDALPEPTA
jgi:hypothetical protein